MAGNKSLNNAKSARVDEFYTQLSDIEKELRHYRKHFKDRIVLFIFDDQFESIFLKYFVFNFNRLGLKKLIATCYTGSPIANQQLSIFDVLGDTEENRNTPYKAIVTTVYDKTGDGGIDMYDIAELFKSKENELTVLEGNGDFRSPECLALLDEADIVVTNPPFSLFRDYIGVLVEHDKSFIIVGNQNAISYEESFALMKANKMWLGATSPKEFIVPRDTGDRKNTYVCEDGTIKAKFGNVCWLTNLDLKKRHEEMILVKRYSPEEYLKYVNYDAIEVSKVADIPCDYAGKMGVPITFMEKYNPDQFEIVGISRELVRTLSDDIKKNGAYAQIGRFYLDVGEAKYKKVYERLVIRNKHPEAPKEG